MSERDGVQWDKAKGMSKKSITISFLSLANDKAFALLNDMKVEARKKYRWECGAYFGMPGTGEILRPVSGVHRPNLVQQWKAEYVENMELSGTWSLARWYVEDENGDICAPEQLTLAPETLRGEEGMRIRSGCCTHVSATVQPSGVAVLGEPS